MPAYAARTVASRPASSTSGIPRPIAASWRPMMRGSRGRWRAAACVRNTACRCCAMLPRSESRARRRTARVLAMSQHNLEAAVAGDHVRTPRLAQVADGLAAAVAVSLPWSTSATSILAVLWLIALVPTLSVAAVRREVMSAAGGLPVLLWMLGALGMLWADVSWSERIAAMSGFHKLLMVPLLLAQFRRPAAHADWVIWGFLASAAVLLVVSLALVLTPGLTWRGRNQIGVPVKNYILQSAIFAICAFA